MTHTLDMDYEVIREYIKNSHPRSVVMVGCDSVRKELKGGKKIARYAAVVAIRNATGEGDDIMYHGCKIFGADLVLPDYGEVIRSGKMKNLKQRMLQEVEFTLQVFENIWEALENRPFEIHLDINEDPMAGSSVAVSEARGYVRGMTGYEPEFKPNALAASFAAHEFAHGNIH